MPSGLRPPASIILRIFFLGHPGHHAGHVLKRQAVAKGDLDRVVDIASDVQHSEPVAFQHRAALFRGEREAVEIGSLVLFERRRFSALLSDMQNMFKA